MRVLLLIALCFSGCAAEIADRSLVASPLLSFEESAQDQLAPHTGLRGGASAGGGACSVCAH